MTFRPSDDVLEEMADNKQSNQSLDQYGNFNNVWDDWVRNFGGEDNFEVKKNLYGENSLLQWNWYWESEKLSVVKVAVEEIKAPDLSELLSENLWNDSNVWNDNISESNEENIGNKNSNEFSSYEKDSNLKWNCDVTDNSATNDIFEAENLWVENSSLSTKNWEDGTSESEQLLDGSKSGVSVSGEITDEDRANIVSWIQSSVHGKLDFLVDNLWLSIAMKYKKMFHFIFRWWALVFVVIVWIIVWFYVQNKWWSTTIFHVIDDFSVKKWDERMDSDKLLSSLVATGNLNVIIPYGSASIDGTSFQSRSNLLSYKWIILPQLVSLDLGSEKLMSLQKFNDKKYSRDDLEKFLKVFVSDNVFEDTADLKNVADSRFNPNTIDGTIDEEFNLSCLGTRKVSNFVCNKFLLKFYNYGKYYDLQNYSWNLEEILKTLKKENENVEDVCEMVKEYTEHSLVSFSSADKLKWVMDFCTVEDYKYYGTLINFMEIESSLLQPELSDKVFDDPDLNAYKLLSSRQYVGKFLRWISWNEGYIKSYLDFVQALIDKDDGSGKLLHPLYKELLYVFNMDYLYPVINKNSSVNLRLQVDQINMMYSVPNSIIRNNEIILIDWNDEIKMEELLDKYYRMTDRLAIRKVSYLSDDKVRVIASLFTNEILSATAGKQLGFVVIMSRRGNALYVDNIIVSGQPLFTQILNTKVEMDGGNVTFEAMIPYINEQISMWYKNTENEEKITVCDELRDMLDLVVYTCNDSSILLYKWDVEYNIVLSNWVLDSFSISDEYLNSLANDRFGSVMTSSENTPTLIKDIIELDIEWVENTDSSDDENIYVSEYFQRHFNIIPDNVQMIEWETNIFLVDFMLWDIALQAYYNADEHLLTKIYYVVWEKTLEIKNLTIELSTENQLQLRAILNNPEVFLYQANVAAYKKYKKMVEEVGGLKKGAGDLEKNR